MKKELKDSTRKRRTIIIISLVGVLVLIGGTIAFNGDLAIFRGLFRLGGMGGEETYVEEFESPDNWACYTSTPKTVNYTNNTGTSRIVRVKLDEYWKEEGSTSSGTTTDLPLDKNGRHLTQISMRNDASWILYDGWYYYDAVVADGDTTSQFMDSVLYACDFSEYDDYECDDTATGQVCESSGDEYERATYHLRLTFQSVDASSSSWPFNPAEQHNYLYKFVADQANPADTTVDLYSNSYIDSGTGAGVNGNGVNRTTERGATVYYYRGQVDNNVIWANYCWKMVRTTATGGVKMIFNGAPADVEVDGEMTKQCTVGNSTALEYNGASQFYYNNGLDSPADLGYMYGDRITITNYVAPDPYNQKYIFSKHVANFDGSVYTLDTSSGNYTEATWNDSSTAINSDKKYYFCTNGASSCSSDKLMYVLYRGGYSNGYVLPVKTYGNIAGVKAAMFAPEHDSVAKKTIDDWFEANNLDGHVADTRNYENDLEDAVYCNDRRFDYGSIAGEDSYTSSNMTASAYNRATSSSAPTQISLYCRKTDSFTKEDTTNGNGALKHKIGMLSTDELIYAGGVSTATTQYTNFQTNPYWTMSPAYMNPTTVYNVMATPSPNYNPPSSSWILRPVVSLRSGIMYTSGTGTLEDPLIVE